MSLEPYVKEKVIRILNEINKYSLEQEYQKIASRGMIFLAMAEIFKENKQWASEFMITGLVLTFLNALFDEEELSKDAQELTKIFGSFVSDSIKALTENDWVQFHVASKEMLWNINELS